jgi:PTS system glucitol/sorbitol-specific IIC component
MTKDLYVSAVTSGQVSPAFQSTASGANVSSAALLAADTHSTDIPAAIAHASSVHDTNIPAANDSAADMPATDMPAADVSMDEMSAAEVPEENMTTNGMHAADAAGSSLSASKKEGSASRTSRSDSRSRHLFRRILEPVSFISKVISISHQSARDAVKTCLDMLLPFMGFAALFIGICRGSGLTVFLAEIMKPMGGSLPGLFLIGILCSIPGLSAILGAGAVAAQIFSTVTGDLILSGSIAPSLALPALFAINCQCACDFIPVGLGMMESKPETMQLGVTSVTLSRFATGWIRILVALVFSIGLYR